jgi:hypothetical protein
MSGDDDRRLHPWVDRAVVVDRSRLLEREREPPTRAQYARRLEPWSAHMGDGVRRAVTVRPHHLLPDVCVNGRRVEPQSPHHDVKAPTGGRPRSSRTGLRGGLRMRGGPAANGRQSQEDDGQQRSADDGWYGEVAANPQLARQFRALVTIGIRSLHERTDIVSVGAGTSTRLLAEDLQRPRKVGRDDATQTPNATVSALNCRQTRDEHRRDWRSDRRSRWGEHETPGLALWHIPVGSRGDRPPQPARNVEVYTRPPRREPTRSSRLRATANPR